MDASAPPPVTYYTLSEPFASREEAEGACNAFLTDLRELRKKHRVADVYVVVRVNVMVPDDENEADLVQVVSQLQAHLGNPVNRVEMVAEAFGAEKAHLENKLARLVSPSAQPRR